MKNKRLFYNLNIYNWFLTVTLLLPVASFGQSQFCSNIISGGGNAWGHSMLLTADSGYIIAGQTIGLGSGGNDAYVVRLNKNGTVRWTKTVGGKGEDVARSIVQTYDGGFAVAGWTNSFGTGRGYDFYVFKLDANGNVLWTRTIGKNGNDMAYSIVQTADSGLAIAGSTGSFGGNSPMYLVRLDRNGGFLWDHIVTTGGTACYGAYSMVQSPDGGYVMCGATFIYTGNISTSSTDFYVAKVSANGSTLQWTTVVRDPTPYDPGVSFIGYDYARRIINTTDGGFMVVGESEQEHSSGGKDWHYLAVKLTANGSISWTRYFGGLQIPGVSIDNSDYPTSVIQTSDGGYVIGGWSFSFNYDFTRAVNVGLELLIVKCDDTGNYLWSKVIGTDPGKNDEADDMVQTPDDGFALVGRNYKTANDQNIYFVKTDPTITACCTRDIGGDRGNGGTHGTAGSLGAAGGTMFIDSGKFSSGGRLYTISACGTLTPPPTAIFESSDTTFCANSCIYYTDLGQNANAWRWTFQGGLPANSTAENPMVCYLSPGDYNVAMVALNSADSDSVMVTGLIHVLPVPNIPNIRQSNDTLYCNYDANYISYQWYKDTTKLIGETHSYYVISTSGNYNLEVTGANGCKIAVGINILGIENTLKGLFTLYPNPSGNKLTIRNAPPGIKEVNIYNALGQKVLTGPLAEGLNKGEDVVDLSALPAGVYMIEGLSPAKKFTGKFVKE